VTAELRRRACSRDCQSVPMRALPGTTGGALPWAVEQAAPIVVASAMTAPLSPSDPSLLIELSPPAMPNRTGSTVYVSQMVIAGSIGVGAGLDDGGPLVYPAEGGALGPLMVGNRTSMRRTPKMKARKSTFPR